MSGGDTALGQARKQVANMLRAQREKLGKTQGDIAMILNVDQSYISQIERGGKSILNRPLADLVRTLAAYGLTINDVLALDPSGTLVEPPRTNAKPVGFRLAPMAGVAQAGRPLEYPIPLSLYRPGCMVFQVDGESMNDGSPNAIRPEDMVLVDVSLKEPMDGKVYLIQLVGDGYSVKRARRFRGEWLFMPDNPAFEPLEHSEAVVVGQVYAVMNARKV